MSNHIKMVFSLSIGLLIVLGWHFATVLGFFGAPPQTRGEFFIRIGIIFIMFLALSAITAGSIAAKAGYDEIEPDEREEVVELKAERNGGVVVMLSLVVLMWFVFTPLTPMVIANILLAILCVGESVKIVSGIRYLRSGV